MIANIKPATRCTYCCVNFLKPILIMQTSISCGSTTCKRFNQHIGTNKAEIGGVECIQDIEARCTHCAR